MRIKTAGRALLMLSTNPTSISAQGRPRTHTAMSPAIEAAAIKGTCPLASSTAIDAYNRPTKHATGTREIPSEGGGFRKSGKRIGYPDPAAQHAEGPAPARRRGQAEETMNY